MVLMIAAVFRSRQTLQASSEVFRLPVTFALPEKCSFAPVPPTLTAPWSPTLLAMLPPVMVMVALSAT